MPDENGPTTMLRYRTPAVLTIAALIGTAAFIGGVHAANTDGSPFRADTTVAPCAAYADTARPHFNGPTVPGICVTADGRIDTADAVTADEPAIPRCATDDSNTAHLPDCYTVRMDGTVLILDAHDTIVSGK